MNWPELNDVLTPDKDIVQFSSLSAKWTRLYHYAHYVVHTILDSHVDTILDSACNKRVSVIVHSCQHRPSTCLFMSLGCGEIFPSPEFEERFQREVPSYLEILEFLNNHCMVDQRKPLCQNELAPFSHFDIMLESNKKTHRQIQAHS